MTLHSATRTIPATPPFDFGQSLAFIASFPPTHGEQRIVDGQLFKAWRIFGHTVLARLSAAGTPAVPALHCEFFAEEPLSDALVAATSTRIAEFLSLTDDLAPFYALAAADPPFAPAIKQLYGLHQVRFAGLFECACWVVLAQRISMAQAHGMKLRLIEAYGDSIEFESERYLAFPERDELEAAGPADLARVIGNERRAAYLRNMIDAIGSVDEAFLPTAPWDEAEAWLRGIKGIGEWSVATILLRALGRTERLMENLQTIDRALAKRYGPNQRPEPLQERYGAWIGYWAYYLRVAE